MRVDVLLGLVGELEIFFHGHGVLDLQQDDWKTNEQASAQKAPAGSEHVDVGRSETIETPHDSATGRLDTLVETSEIGELAAVVCESAHVPVKISDCHFVQRIQRVSSPVDNGLPDSIVHSVENVQEHRANVSGVLEIVGGVVIGGVIRSIRTSRHFSTRVSALEGPATTPHNHGQDKQSCPCSLRANGSPDGAEIEQEAEDGSSNDLSEPVQHAVQSAGTGVEFGGIDVVEVVGVEPV